MNYPDKKLYIASQCVVNLPKLLAEIREIEAAGISVLPRLRMSGKASLIQPGHILRDLATMKHIGTTGNGIGAAYADQKSRMEGDRRLDVRLEDFLTNAERAMHMVRRNFAVERERYEGQVTAEELRKAMECLEGLPEAIEKLRGNIDIGVELLLKEIRRGARILFEGAQAFGLDNTFGPTPEVTSSNTGVAAAFTSGAIPVDYKRYAYAVAKLIPSSVGFSPFPTEFGGDRSEQYCMEDGGNKHRRKVEEAMYGHRIEELLRSSDPFEVGIAFRMRGGEYGATTGRPRRLGHLDLQPLEFALAINGINGLYLTKADCLGDFSKLREPKIRIATDYRMGDQLLTYMPTNEDHLRKVEPVYTDYQPFAEDISGTRSDGDLPAPLLCVLQDIQDRLQTPIVAVGVGPEREQVVRMNGALD